MKPGRSPSAPSGQNVVRFDIAHINLKGADLIFIPLDPSIGQKTGPEQGEVLRMLQHCASSAGLRGTVVLVWDKGGGSTGFLAERQVHGHIQGTTLGFVLTKINRKLAVTGFHLARPSSAAPAAEEKSSTGTLSITTDHEDCEVFVDSASVGVAPAKVKLAGGVHVIEVKKPGYAEFKREVRVTEGSETNLKATLERDETIMISHADTMTFQNALDGRGKFEDFQRQHRVGLVTLLFTDIVGSTKLKQELGDREAVRLIQSHHGTVRGILTRFPAAREISTSGDSFFMVFAKPSDAVRFSLLLQAKLRVLARETGRRVYDRIGIHVGEVFIEEVGSSGGMNDLYGIQVDSCARVMSLGEGDQILMTRFAYDNARQTLKGQEIETVGPLTWVNHGLYSLKGVEEPLEICEVGETGLAVLRPPPDSDKVHRVTGDGEGPAASPPPQAHVVVSSRPQQVTTLRPRPFSPNIKGSAH